MRHRWCGLLILCSIFLIGAPAFGQLDLLKKAADVGAGLADLQISEAEEIELGEAISEKIRERYGVVQDRDETRYLSRVGLTVARQTDRPHLPYRFIILDSGSVNAFAVPGGIVHITRGALAVIGSEAELAGVLGHEVAHITQKHTIKAIKKDKSIDLASSASGLDDNLLMAKLADKATDMVLAGYGREQEVNSDQAGVVFAARAGYSQEGLLRFLDTLKKRSSSGSGGLFRSHPETDNRIKRVGKVIDKEHLDESIWLTARYDAEIDYEAGGAGTGGPAVDGARGAAGASDAESGGQEKPKKKKSRFGLGKLKKTFIGGGDEQQTAEVTGAGAARGVGDEEDESQETGPKNPALVDVQISEAELRAFQEEGGLKGS